MMEEMGLGALDDHHDYLLGVARLRVDREVGLQSNRYLLMIVGQADQAMARDTVHQLFGAAEQGQAQFSLVAATEVSAWGVLSGAEQADVWGVFKRGQNVGRFLEVYRGAPSYHAPAPQPTPSQDDALRSASTVDRQTFDALAATLLSPWWGQIPAEARELWFDCYADE